MTKETKLVAICGIDGAGKSTIVNQLERRLPTRKYSFVRKKTSPNLDLVRKFHGRHRTDGKEWVEGSFARASAYAWGLDFLQHYEDTIKPLLGLADNIVCDRYSMCAIAFAKVTGVDLKDLLVSLKPADLTLWVTVEVENVYRRYETRGSNNDDENSYVMPLFHQAYVDLFKGNGSRIVELDNNGDIAEVIDRAEELIHQLNE